MEISTDPYKKEESSLGVDYVSLLSRDFPEISDLVMQKYGWGAPVSLYVEIYSRANQPRGLDKMPTALKQKSDTGLQSGVKDIFKAHFSSVKIRDDEESMGIFELQGNRELKCDVVIIRAFKALAVVGACKNDEITKAVLEVFPALLRALLTNEYTTVKMFLSTVDSTLELTKSYYSKQILIAIQEVLLDA